MSDQGETAGGRDAAQARADGHDRDLSVEVLEAIEPAGRWRPSSAAAIALAIGLLVTAALSIVSLELYRHNERRLLNLRVRELSLVLSGAASSIQTPLASATALADATGGSAVRFKAFITPYVGPHGQFVSASLWQIGADGNEFSERLKSTSTRTLSSLELSWHTVNALISYVVRDMGGNNER